MTPKNPSFKNTLTKISDKHFYKKSGFVRISIFCFYSVGTMRALSVIRGVVVMISPEGDMTRVNA